MRRKLYVDVENRSAYIDYSRVHPNRLEDFFAACQRHWAFFVPVHRFGKARARFRGWDGWTKLYKVHSAASVLELPTGLFLPTFSEFFDDVEMRCLLRDHRKRLQSRQRKLPALRDDKYQFQHECVSAMEKTKTGGLILNATGSGKTRVACLYCWRTWSPTVFIVDQRTLLDQSYQAFQKVLGAKWVGKIGEGVWDPRRFTIATVQSLQSKSKTPAYQDWSKRVRVVMIDELHTMLNTRQRDVLRTFDRARQCFGFTATLRLSRKDVRLKSHAFCGPVLYRYPLTRGVDDKVLTQGIVVRVPFFHYGSDQMTPNDQIKAFIVENKRRNKLILRLIKVLMRRKIRTVVFVERLRHIDILGQLLDKRGIKHDVIFGQVPTKTRQAISRDFARGEVRCLLVNKVFFKGVDVPSIEALIDTTGSASINETIQKFGRGVRLSKGKGVALHFDIADASDPAYSHDCQRNNFEKPAAIRLAAFQNERIPIKSLNPNTRLGRQVDLLLKGAPKQGRLF